MSFAGAPRALIKIISSCCFIGYFPLIPGTMASLCAAAAFYALGGGSSPLYPWLVCSFLVLGFLVSGSAEKAFGRKDPPFVVIDEVAGMLLALSFIPCDIRAVFLAFLFFRIFDTLKVYPAGLIQRIKGSAGIMADDIIAGVYANITLHLVLKLVSFRSS